MNTTNEGPTVHGPNFGDNLEDHPIAALLPLLKGAELDELVLSMRTHGYDVMHPILIHEGKILDGRNRYRAAKIAGVRPSFDIPFEKGEVGDPWDLVWRENSTRRHLDPGQKAALHIDFVAGSKRWQQQHAGRKQAANEARSTTQAGRPKERSTPREVPRSGSKSDRTASAAKALASSAGVSRSTMERALELKKKNPEAHARVGRGEIPLARALAETKKAAVVADIKAKPKPLPGGKHHVIVADPPWRYDTSNENSNERGAVEYPDMSIAEICALPVAKLAEDNCILFLWTTNAFMRQAYQCLDAWGFAEKTILTWDKEKIGVGHWLRNSTEHCILAVRGRPVVQLTNQSTLLRAPRREHSRKPDAFYALVETLCPGSKVELFARQPRKGWSVWGAEKEKFDAL
jgi:N6-adenosine-specific RNA methylase IME4